MKHRNTWEKRCIPTYFFKTEIFITQQNKLEANKTIDRSTPSLRLWLIDWLLVAARPSVNISCIFRNWTFLVMTRDLGWIFRCAPCSSGTPFYMWICRPWICPLTEKCSMLPRKSLDIKIIATIVETQVKTKCFVNSQSQLSCFLHRINEPSLNQTVELNGLSD